MTDDVESVVSQPKRYKFLDNRRLQANYDGVHADIKSYLAKPVILQTGVFASTDGPSTFTAVDVMAGLSATVMWDKIKTIYALSATAVITLQFNGNAFQQGRGILAHLPTGGMIQSGTAFNDFVKAHRWSRFQVTALPHAQFDFNTDTSATLRIPYQSAVTAMPVYTGFGTAVFGSPGIVFIYPYMPMTSTAGSTTIPFTMWVHYEDVILHSNIVPQSGVRSGRGNKKDIIASEMGKKGPVETGARLVTDVASALVGIPLLSSVAGPVSWLADALARTAATFGWSKPTLVTPPIRTMQTFAPYLSNVNAVSTAQPLSLRVDNHVDVLPGFAGSDYDELSIDFLKGITTFFRAESWTTASIAGANLVDLPIRPAMFRTVITDGGGTLEATGPIGYLDYQFNYWRGGFNLKIIFVKTHFHSGRLAISFEPIYPTLTGGLTTFGNTAYVAREIIDIRLTNEYNITIPYINTSQWTPTSSLGTGDDTIGRLLIHVVDPLVAPANVSSTIAMLFEGCGADDLQFAVPAPCLVQPCIPLDLQSGVSVEDFMKADLHPQSGLPVTVTSLESVGSTKHGELFLEAYSDCIGEAHLSLRELLKRGGFLSASTITASSTNLIAPHLITWRRSQLVGAPLGGEEVDSYNTIASFYHSSRGGMRIGWYSSLSTTVEQTIKAFNYVAPSGITSAKPIDASAWTFTQVAWRTNNSACAMGLRSTGGTMFQLPQYLPRHNRVIGAQIVTSTTTLGYGSGSVSDPNLILLRTEGASSQTPIVWRAAADDYNLGGFVSIPPLYLPVIT